MPWLVAAVRMCRALDAITRVAGEMEQAGSLVSELEKESAQINLVVDVIRGIADQTNLLALNAAIEAARAGEQGAALRWWPTRCTLAGAPRPPPAKSSPSSRPCRPVPTGRSR
jgi:hypothetical protein